MSLDVETGEIVESTAIELRPANLFAVTDQTAVLSQAVALADQLKDVLKAKKLIANIQGKEHPLVEAWTLLGSMLGVFPIVVWSRPLPNDSGWEARVEARTRSGEIVGAAEAECTRSERSWSQRDDYALRSMAQTRATSKALRLPLGFVMVLAGYEATPADEIPFDSGVPPSHAGSKTDPGLQPHEPMWIDSPTVRNMQMCAVPQCSLHPSRRKPAEVPA